MFPKIPDPQEIAAMVTKQLEPMMNTLTEIRDLLREQNQLQREQLAFERAKLTGQSPKGAGL